MAGFDNFLLPQTPGLSSIIAVWLPTAYGPRDIPGCEWRDAEFASPGEEGNVFASRVWKGIAEPAARASAYLSVHR